MYNEAQQEALDILAANGLDWSDFPEWQGKSVSIQEIRSKVPMRASAREFAQADPTTQKAWLKEYESQVKAKDSEVAKSAPSGSPSNENPIKDITDPTDLYRLARKTEKWGRENSDIET